MNDLASESNFDSHSLLLRLVNELQGSATFEDAATELWQRLHQYLEWRTSALIADRYRGQVSEESAVNDAFRSFLSGAARGEFEVQDRGGLVGLLATMAANKLRSRLREITAIKRNPAPASDGNDEHAGDLPPEQPLDRPRHQQNVARNYRSNHPVTSDLPPDSDFRGPELDQFLGEMDAVLIAIIREKVESLDADLQRFFFLRYIDGFTDDEIGREMGISRQAARWKHETIKEAFGDFLDRDES